MEESILQNARVLVVEDDYYLATDLQAALEAAGAHVVGPFANIEDASQALAADQPDCALVDINLGRGISFELPHQLAKRSVRFAFVTGYDRDVIPEEFTETIRVEKPVALHKVAEIVARLLSLSAFDAASDG